MNNSFKISILAGIMTFTSGIYADAQTHAADSVMNHAGGKRLSIGGYGEAAYSRNF
jgi:hypothetical protein